MRISAQVTVLRVVEVAWKASSRLLKKVRRFSGRSKSPTRNGRQRLEVDGDWVVIRLKVIYLEATVNRRATRLPHFGHSKTSASSSRLEKHNFIRERQSTQDDGETLKTGHSKRRGSTSRSPLTKMAGSTEWHREIEFHWLALPRPR